MNIKIERSLHTQLLVNTPEENVIEFGSSGGADRDLLFILPPNIQMDCALHNRDHFLFYKDEQLNIDYLYATPRCLLNGLVTGSSTLLYELLIEGKLYGTSLEWLTEVPMEDIINYKLAKAFIGIAQRDLKQANKLPRGKDKTKKMHWVRENIYTVLDMCHIYGIKYYEENLEELREEIKSLPKCSSLDLITYSYRLPKPIDIPEISTVEYAYFKNWEESL